MSTLYKAYAEKKGTGLLPKEKSPKTFFGSAYAELAAVGRAVGEAIQMLTPTGKKRIKKDHNKPSAQNLDEMNSMMIAEPLEADVEITRIREGVDRIDGQTIPDSISMTAINFENDIREQLELTEQVYELRKSIQRKRAALCRSINESDQTAQYDSTMFTGVSVGRDINAVTHCSEIDEESNVRSNFIRRKPEEEDMGKAFASAFTEYLQPVEVMVGKVLRGKSDTESMAALIGMLSSLRSVSSRMGFETVQKLLDQLYLRILIVDGDPRVPITREIRLAILRDLFKLRDIAAQMGGVTDKSEKDPLT